MRFQIDDDFSAEAVISERARAGQIFHIRRNHVGTGMTLTAIARYFAWQPQFTEGYHSVFEDD